MLIKNTRAMEKFYMTSKPRTVELNPFVIGSYEFARLLKKLPKGKTIKVVTNCNTGSHDDDDYIIHYVLDDKKGWRLVMQNAWHKYIGFNKIMQAYWVEFDERNEEVLKLIVPEELDESFIDPIYF